MKLLGLNYRERLQTFSDHKALYEMSKNTGGEWSFRAAGGAGGVSGTSYCCGEDGGRPRGRGRCGVSAAAGWEAGGLFSRRWPNYGVTGG